MNVEADHTQFHLIEGPKVEAWKEGVDSLLADVAIHLACDAEPQFYKVKTLREGNLSLDPSNIPDLETWFTLYQDGEKLISQVFEYLAPHLPEPEPGQPRISDTLTANSLIPEDIDVHSLFNSFIPQDAPTSEDTELDWETAPPAFLFFILVWVPCYCLHGEIPTNLLSQAQSGDLKAARKLLQLDKSLMGEPGIAKRIQAWSAQGETESIAKLGSYLGESVADVSMKQVKITQARFILDTSERRGLRLSAPKIQELFNAIAQDSGRGIQDPDIGEMSPESFAKALSRQQGFWKPMSNSTS
jgi:hypothetical protein